MKMHLQADRNLKKPLRHNLISVLNQLNSLSGYSFNVTLFQKKVKDESTDVYIRVIFLAILITSFINPILWVFIRIVSSNNSIGNPQYMIWLL